MTYDIIDHIINVCFIILKKKKCLPHKNECICLEYIYIISILFFVTRKSLLNAFFKSFQITRRYDSGRRWLYAVMRHNIIPETLSPIIVLKKYIETFTNTTVRTVVRTRRSTYISTCQIIYYRNV